MKAIVDIEKFSLKVQKMDLQHSYIQAVLLGITGMLILTLSPLAQSADDTTSRSETRAQIIEASIKAKSPGRAPAKGLKIKSSGVATFEFEKRTTIGKGKSDLDRVKLTPRLDIGEEKELEFNQSEIKAQTQTLNLKAPEKKQSPPVVKFDPKKTKVLNVNPALKVTDEKALKDLPGIKDLPPSYSPQFSEVKLNTIELISMGENDFKLLEALIFLEKKINLEIALGLLSDLLDDPKLKPLATYLYASTARSLHLNSDYRIFMLKVALSKQKEYKDLQKSALTSLVDNGSALEVSDLAEVDPLVYKAEIDTNSKDEYQIKRAKYYLKVGKLGEVEDALFQISEQSKLKVEALFLSGIFNYNQAKISEAILELEKMVKLLEVNKTDPLRTIGYLTLARMYFQKNMYKEAFNTYLLIDKNDPMWLQAMVEQAWTQILSQDYEGAAGNMFSLHTDFFKHSFSPESYVARTVGYLNLCQFGDGAQVLENMKHKYGPLVQKLDQFRKQAKNPSNYYDTIKLWMKNPALKEADGLPKSFIIELARHPNFIKLQQLINNFEDEVNVLNTVAMNILEREKTIVAQQKEVTEKIAAVKSQEKGARTVASQEDLPTLESQLASFKTQYQILQKVRNTFKKIRVASMGRIDSEKSRVKETAGNVLKERFDKLYTVVKGLLDQNDLLKYETYAGAGEHLRFQMAGGEVNEKYRPELKVDEEKRLNWKFQGEVWEDEVGHYRSSLKNVCAPDQK